MRCARRLMTAARNSCLGAYFFTSLAWVSADNFAER